MGSIQITILILQYNGLELTKRLIQSLKDHGELSKYKVILADNSSTEPDGFEWFRENYPTITLVKHKENYGFAKGINKLFKLVDTPYFLLLNNDIILQNSAISKTLSCLESNQADAATCMMYEVSGRIMHNTSYAISPAQRVLRNVSGVSKVKRYLNQRYKPRPHPVAYINGGFLLIKSALFNQVKGFYEKYFMYTEDLDLMLKFKRVNAKLMFCPDGKVIHADGSTTRKIWTDLKKEEVQTKQVIDCYRRHFDRVSLLVFKGLLSGRIVTRAVLSGNIKRLKLLKYLNEKK